MESTSFGATGLTYLRTNSLYFYTFAPPRARYEAQTAAKLHLQTFDPLAQKREEKYALPSTFVEGLNNEVDEVIKRCLKPERKERFQNALELRDALQKLS